MTARGNHKQSVNVFWVQGDYVGPRNAKCHRKEARLPRFSSCCASLKFVQRCPGLNQRSPGLIRCRGLEQRQKAANLKCFILARCI